MTILMLNYEYPPLGGGAGKATQNIAYQLVAMGYSVHVITSHTGFIFKRFNDKGVIIHAVPSFRNGIHDCGLKGAAIFLFFAYLKILSLNLVTKFDVVHYFFSLPTGLLSLFPGRHKRLPYILSLRGSDVPGYDIYNKKLEFMHKMSLPVTKLIWKRAREVVAVTPSLKKTALITNPRQEISIIPNGIDVDLFKPYNHFRKSDDEFRLIIVSRLIERKGIQYVLKALSELKDNCIKLIIIGEGNYGSELKKLCKDSGLSEQVTFLGFCSREEIPRHLSQSDVFILPSLAEAFGNVVAEAMACGLPVIGANEGGIPDLVSCENGILVQPGNIEQIKSAIIKMKLNKEMRLLMGKANFLKIEQGYKWSNVASTYKDLYLKSVNGHLSKN